MSDCSFCREPNLIICMKRSLLRKYACDSSIDIVSLLLMRSTRKIKGGTRAALEYYETIVWAGNNECRVEFIRGGLNQKLLQ